MLQNLGSKEEFTEILNQFPIGELFKVALYLGSDTLLYHLVIDKLRAATAVTLLDVSMDILGMDHYITKTITQFTCIIAQTSRYNVIHYMQTNKPKLRLKIRNNMKRSGEVVTGCLRRPEVSGNFMEPFKKPDICLCCMLPITGLDAKDMTTRLLPMGCCGMMVHLKCHQEFLKRINLPTCPACGTTYQHGKIDNEYRMLGEVLTICQLNNCKVLPLPYRVRNIDWLGLSQDYLAIHGPSNSEGGYPG